MAKQTKRKTIIIDIILVLALLIIATVAFFVWKSYTGGEIPTDSAVVVVRQGNTVIERLPLNADIEKTIGEGGTNKIKIEGGAVRMIWSTCPGYQDCVEYGSIALVGDKIVCLPNQIIVSIEE